MELKKVIIVTDGDMIAKGAVEEATKNIGGRCISLSAGNPTMLNGYEIIELIKIAVYDPVIVMVDDRGIEGKGKGEEALQVLLESDEIKLLGVVAVASNGKDKNGPQVDFSIDCEGNKIENAVDKCGLGVELKEISGDTLSVIKKFRSRVPLIVGIGDPGKMDKKDKTYWGAPITTKALEEIIAFSKNASK